MSAAARVLRAPTFSAAAVNLPGPTEADPGVAAAVAHARQEGFRLGREEGLREGRREATEFAPRMDSAVDRALAGFAHACAMTRVDLATDLAEMAALVVEAVLEHEPDSAVTTMLVRIASAMEMIEDGPLTVSVHPSTLDIIEPVLELRAGGEPVQRRGDPMLRPGEIVIEGPWVRADLTWGRLVEAARAALVELQAERAEGGDHGAAGGANDEWDAA